MPSKFAVRLASGGKYCIAYVNGQYRTVCIDLSNCQLSFGRR